MGRAAGDGIERFREIDAAGLSVVEDSGGALDPASQVDLKAGRVSLSRWHRGLQRSATRLFSALASGDRKTLADLIPDAALRARLPAGLLPEAACDSQNPDTLGTAIVAAAAPLPDGRRAPCSLWWGRGPSGWRLTGAAPVLQ